MLLEYIVLLNQILLLPYIIKLKSFMIMDFNYLAIMLIGLALHYFIFYLLLKIKYIGKYILLFFLSVPFLIFNISLFIFKYKMDSSIIASALENENEFALGFINFKIILFSLIFIFLIYILIKNIKCNKKYGKKLFIVSLLIMVVSFCYVRETKNKQYFYSYPILDFFNLFRINDAIEGFKISEKKNFIYDKTILKSLFNYNEEEDINIVLIIGESARSDFFNKYATNIQNRDIINLIQSQSGYQYTRGAVPEILTMDKGKSSYSIVDIMNSLGFNTFWIGAQGIRATTESPYAHFALHSKKRIYNSGSKQTRDDFILLDYLDRLMEAKGKNFYIIHQIGSHAPFFNRFEEEFAKFKDYCKTKDMLLCSEEQIQNAYANTIVKTDYFLNALLDKFKNKKNTLIYYTSDHGVHIETLSKDSNLVVPAFFWVNGKFSDYKNTMQNNVIGHNFSHKKIVESILDCIGVNSSLINKENSFCSEKYKK